MTITRGSVHTTLIILSILLRTNFAIERHSGKDIQFYVWKVIGINDVQVICRGDVVTWASPPTSLRIIWIVWMYNRSFFFFSIRPLFEPDLYKFIYLNIYIHISLSLSLLNNVIRELEYIFLKKKRGGYSDIRWKTFAKRKFIKILLNSIVNFWILANPAGDECLETISLSSNFSSLAPL